jgi:hypothetical protein
VEGRKGERGRGGIGGIGKDCHHQLTRYFGYWQRERRKEREQRIEKKG